MSNRDLSIVPSVEKLPQWLNKRAAGVLLHPSSLPGGYGIGCLGQSARNWIDFLSDAGFSYWQMCPVGPTGFGDSPYQVFSSSAGNPYFIDWEPLISLGYIRNEDLNSINHFAPDQVDYGSLWKTFFPLMRVAHRNFLKNSLPLENKYGSLGEFKNLHASWLEPFAKFQTLKTKNDLKPWWLWDQEDKNAAKSRIPDAWSEEYDFHIFLQFIFRSQWEIIHHYAKSKKVSLIGDLPIYVAPDSSDTWYNPELFQIGKDGKFQAVAGVPPDYFNESGQLWGNPLYDWEKMHTNGYDWWVNRIQDQLDLFEVVRIDHFRGFHDYWSIPEGSTDAKRGKWKTGPGSKFWEKMKKSFPLLPFLAEDLGDINKGVRNLRISSGLPGMAVLQFAFDGNPQNLYLPHNLSKDLVLYTGTHDNDTSCGWYDSTNEETRSFFRNYFNIDGSAPGWDMLRHAYRSVSQLVVVLAQDLLSLGNEARLNTPGEPCGNWQWRMTEEQFTNLRNHSCDYLREQAFLADRFREKLG